VRLKKRAMNAKKQKFTKWLKKHICPFFSQSKLAKVQTFTPKENIITNMSTLAKVS
jgi:hypothetical protein